MDNTANTNDPRTLEVGVIECQEAPGEWLVEAVDHGSDGEVYRAIFSGPRALETALDYAATKYGHNGAVMSQPTILNAPRPSPNLALVRVEPGPA